MIEAAVLQQKEACEVHVLPLLLQGKDAIYGARDLTESLNIQHCIQCKRHLHSVKCLMEVKYHTWKGQYFQCQDSSKKLSSA